MEQQLALIYATSQQTEGVLVEQVRAQQRTGGADCGVFAIATAIHVAQGDVITNIHFEQKLMRAHLITCLEENKFTRFPTTSLSSGQVKRAQAENILVNTYCTCKMPECFDDNMVACDVCDTWYHYKCVDICSTPDSFICMKKKFIWFMWGSSL